MIIGKDHTRAVDFYTLGCLLYEMMVGFPPFHSQDVKNLEKRIVSNLVRFPENFDLEARDLIEWLLAKDPDMRPEEFSEIKKHAFFKDIHWGRVAKKQAIPPWIPDLEKCHAPKKFTSIPLNKVFYKQKLFQDGGNASCKNRKDPIDSFKKSMIFYDQNSNREERDEAVKAGINFDETLYLEGNLFNYNPEMFPVYLIFIRNPLIITI